MTDPFAEFEHQLRERIASTAQPGVAGRWRRWRRAGTFRGPALVFVALTGAGGVAYAASTLLQTGPAVPADGRSAPLGPPVGQPRVILTAPDPAGGLPWGLAVVRQSVGDTGQLTCSYAGRTQNGVVGVVGSDGAFENDGRFHPLDPDSTKEMSCGGGDPATGQFIGGGSAAQMPASGYSGNPGARSNGQRIVGCILPRERSEPGRPDCESDRMRLLKYGFAGGDAVKVVYGNRKRRQSVTPPRGSAGAYLFVSRPGDGAGGGPSQLEITYADGERCTELVPHFDEGKVERIEPCPRMPQTREPQTLLLR